MVACWSVDFLPARTFCKQIKLIYSKQLLPYKYVILNVSAFGWNLPPFAIYYLNFCWYNYDYFINDLSRVRYSSLGRSKFDRSMQYHNQQKFCPFSGGSQLHYPETGIIIIILQQNDVVTQNLTKFKYDELSKKNH